MKSNPKEWWNDTSAICYVCLNNKIFSTFEPNETGGKAFMGNFATSKIKGPKESGLEDDL